MRGGSAWISGLWAGPGDTTKSRNDIQFEEHSDNQEREVYSDVRAR